MIKKRKARTVAKLVRRRSPGLDGTYSGTCIACLRPTDTALGFRGEPEWHAAGLTRLGLPTDEAIATVDRFLVEMAEGGGYTVAEGRYDMVYRVCGQCAEHAGFPSPALAIGGATVPVIAQRGPA